MKVELRFYLIYLILTIIIVEKSSNFGHIFVLDIFPIKDFFTDQFYGYIPSIFGGRLLISMITELLHVKMPDIIIQNIYIFLIIFLSGISMNFLIGDMIRSSVPKIFMSVLYMLNPFTYIRFLVGHWMILLAYSVMPFAIKNFINFLDNHNKKNLIKLLFITVIIGSLSSHMMIILFLSYSILMIYKLLNIKNEKIKIRNLFLCLSIFGILFLILNAYWFLPFIVTKKSMIDNIGEKDFEAFSSKEGLFDIAAMYGFWREGYTYAKDFIPGWQILYLVILSLAIIGFLAYYKDEKIGYIVKAMTIIGIIGFILASGINGLFGDQIYWLFENTILKGFRDSHKFVSMMVLAYAVLGGLGLSRFEAMSEKKKYLKAIIAIALIIPFIYSFTFFNGFAGQIKPTDYPADWYEVNDLLKQDGQDFKILFFPWHGYMDFKWVNNTDKRIANPSKNFFDKKVISSTTVELGKIYRQDNAPDQLYIDSLLENKSNITNFGELVSILNVKYVILAKEVDYRNYNFLFNQSDLELVKETDTLYVFKNENKVAKIYQTDNIENIGDKEEVGYKTINPVRFEIGETNRKYLVFTEPYSEDWKLDGTEPLKAYGAVNAFENGGKEIRFERFYRVNLPAYIISILTFVGLIAVYLGSERKKKKM